VPLLRGLPRVFVLGAGVLLGALCAAALWQGIAEALSTGWVYRPRISRYHPAEMVPWQDAVVYLCALFTWGVTGLLSAAALIFGPVVGRAAAGALFSGVFLFLVFWWHIAVVLAVLALIAAGVCSAWKVGPKWAPPALVGLAIMALIHAAAP
jgi:hypothetical protein